MCKRIKQHHAYTTDAIINDAITDTCKACKYAHLRQGFHPDLLDQQLACICLRHIARKKAKRAQFNFCKCFEKPDDKTKPSTL